MNDLHVNISKRFNGLLPIVVDIETGGVDCRQDALLEIAAILVRFDSVRGWVCDGASSEWHEHVEPFEGSHCRPEALAFNHIIPDHPLRFAISENQAFKAMAVQIGHWLKVAKCRRAVLVGHNAHFDLNFIMNAVERCQIKHFPLHRFTCFDTATLGGILYGETVLARVVQAAGLSFDVQQAHGALYDAQKTAELFCKMLNECQPLRDLKF